jgi:hypothetical protein
MPSAAGERLPLKNQEVTAMKKQICCLISCSAALLLAADSSWKTKEISQWSAEDAQQLLKNSPWVKKTLATILPKRSEAQQRDSGRMGGGEGAGIEALSPGNFIGFGRPSRRFAANLRDQRTVIVRWESASPVHSAEVKIGDMDAPTWDGNYYAIAVYAVPGLEDRKNLPVELRKTAFLRREGKKDVLPARVDLIYTDEKSATVLYLFPLSLAITAKDRDIWFAAQIGQLFVEQNFDAGEMQFRGKLEL